MTDSTNDPTNDRFEQELASSMAGAVDAVSGEGATRRGVDVAIARRRSLQRRRIGVAAAAAVLVVVGAGAALAARPDGPATVRAAEDPTPTATSEPPTTVGSAVACPVAEVEIPGLVRLTEVQLAVLTEAGMVDPATVYAARRGPVPISPEVSELLSDRGAGLDGEQLFGLGYDVAGIEYVRDDRGVYVGYRCPDGFETVVATTSPATTTSTPSTTTTIVTTTAIVGAEPGVVVTAPPNATTTVPAGSGQVLSADLAEGQAAWAVYVDAISLLGPPIDGHPRAAEAEDRWFEAQEVLGAAELTPELLPLPCDGAAAVDAVLAILPDGPADADPDDVYVMGAYFLDESAARRAADRLGAQTLRVVPVTATCVDVDGPTGYRR
jgi:hypothetical protein